MIDDTDFGIVGQVCESSLFSYMNSLKKYDARELADLIFLYIISLQILKSEFDTQPFAIDYAKHTISNDFDNFRTSGTDLHIMIHTLFGKNNLVFNLLDKQDSSKLLKNRMSLNTNAVHNWLSNFRKNKIDENVDNRFLLKLENDLQITTSDYKSMRRLVGEWSSLSEQQRQLVMTRLLFALKKKASRSEILPVLIKLANRKNLVIKGAKNPEEVGSDGKMLKTLALGIVGATVLGALAIHKTNKH